MANVNFLFWNLFGNGKGQPLREPAIKASLGRLATNYDVDVFLFAECAISRTDLVATLNGAGESYRRVPSSSERIVCISRLPNAQWIERLKNSSRDRHVIQSVQVGASREILLVGVHCRSQLEVPSEGGRAELAQDIRPAFASGAA